MAETAQKNEEKKTLSQKDEGKDEKVSSAHKNTGSASSQDVEFAKDITIHMDKPLPHLDKGTVRAYSATGTNKIFQNLVAYVCDKTLTPRRGDTAKYHKVAPQGLVKLVKAGVIFWPKVEAERFCLVYENAMGKALIAPEDRSPKLGWKHDEVIINIAQPFIQTLVNLRNMDVVHGEIWPGNMFHQGSDISDKIMLGECLTAPNSYHLPALYETVERALADPIARGIGTTGDDLYSFGVSLAVIMRSHDPMQGKSDKEIIEHKIEKGTYATVLGKDRLSGAALELLRGLLYDDPEQRWTLEDLEAWADGRRLSPKQSPKRVKATRPLILNERKYIRPELLAIDMTDHADEMIRIVENGDLNLWIERALEDKTIKVRVEQTLKDIEGYDRTEGYSARATAALATALYPEIPVHFRDIRFNIDGFGKSLTKAYQDQKDLQDYMDVMRSMFVISCVRLQKIQNMASFVSKFDSCRKYLNKTDLNLGLERCLYFMNPESHCLSPILEKYYVQSPEDFLSALEKICSENNPKVIFDRHIISFLSVKDRRNVDPYLPELSSSEPYRRMLGRIRTLATIQKRSGHDNCPALADWISRNLGDVYERFHDAKKQESIKNLIEKTKKSGDLTKIALCFEDPKLFQSDLGGFYQAMQHYKSLKDEETKIKDRLENKKNYGYRSGEQVASVVSMAVAFFIMIIAALNFFTG
jgi:hypothetical protein